MEITTRISASGFIELKVDEIETNFFKSHPDEIDKQINNLLSVVEDLAGFKNQTITIIFDKID